MNKSDPDPLVITGTPLIGEGNVVDNRSFMAALTKSGIPALEFYPDGAMVRLGRWFHVRMSMSTKKTMHYAIHSGTARSSFKLMPLKLELRRAIEKVRRENPGALCFLSSQDMMAEEGAECIDDIPAIMFSSDVNGKFSNDMPPSARQKKVIHLVWSREAFNFYKSELGIPHVYLTIPTDPKDAFEHIEREQLPFQEALNEPDICYIKLSGSGGDSGFINSAVQSLWKKSRTRSIVFPGTEGTLGRLVQTVGRNVKINSSLDPAVFYNHLRQMISGQQMLLTYPSEQVKHIAVLAMNNIYPKVAWLPPRGQHEMYNLAWAINKRLSGTVCVPPEYWSLLSRKLIDLGVKSSDIEFIEPENIAAEHFKQSPAFQSEKGVVSLVHIVRRIMNS